MYCNQADILTRITAKELAKLTDDVNATVVDDDLVDTLIESQSNLIDGYLRGRYPLPITSTILTTICIDLVCYELYKRRSKITESISKSYDYAVSRLNKIQSGVIQLQLENTEKPIMHISVSNTVSPFNESLTRFAK
jgi:phage gp36-like protein